jgi:predicted CopG family antitoxin
MEHHYPDSAWIAMRRDVFDQLYEFKRREGLSSWDEVLERLLTPNGSVAS